MIGVVCRPDDVAVFREFFELFKTPWELYQPGRHYDVVLATTDDVPDSDMDIGLLVIYGAHTGRDDERIGVETSARRPRGLVRYRGAQIPIYGVLHLLTARGAGTAWVTTHDGAIAGVRIRAGRRTIVRLGWDLAHEVRALLWTGQPPEHAHVATLDLHVAMLRELILDAGVPLIEIPAAPAGHPFAVCLTHDIDFAGIRYHRLDHTMWGFLYRATLGALGRTWRGRLTRSQCAAAWRAAASLPFVYLGWAKDFWEPFDWYLRVEHGLPATYFLIPFKHRPGERVTARGASRRGAAYDVDDIAHRAPTLQRHGAELAVHGIDAWHSAERGRAELARIAALSGEAHIGIRMHWLCGDDHTPRLLEEAGYAWDASLGYNETVGYLNGTTQPFRPRGATTLLELPLHIQDGALFYSTRLDLSAADAWTRCASLIDDAARRGGALSVLWHDRSHAAERFWGDFYIRLLDALKARRAWFGTAGDVIEWFTQRRAVHFERTSTGTRIYHDGEVRPPLAIRVHHPRAATAAETWSDIPWTGREPVEMPRRPAPVTTSRDAAAPPEATKACA